MRNTGAAIYAKLKAEGKRRQVDTSIMIRCWVMEGFLRRFSFTPFRERYALKGSHLFNIWDQRWTRYPRDIDLESMEAFTAWPTEEIIDATVRLSRAPNDGLQFDATSTMVDQIDGPGVTGERAAIKVHLASATCVLQIDISRGHPLLGSAPVAYYPSLLPGMLPVPLLCSPIATAVAEHLAYLVEFGEQATRVQDLFGLWRLASSTPLQSTPILAATELTFSHRWAAKALAGYHMERTFSALAKEPKIQSAWRHWREKSGAPDVPNLEDVLIVITKFAEPLLLGLVERTEFTAQWIPGTGWQYSLPKPRPLERHTSNEVSVRR